MNLRSSVIYRILPLGKFRLLFWINVVTISLLPIFLLGVIVGLAVPELYILFKLSRFLFLVIVPLSLVSSSIFFIILSKFPVKKSQKKTNLH